MKHVKEKNRVAKTRVTFLDLPTEVRDMIYKDCFPKALYIDDSCKAPKIFLYTEAATVLHGQLAFTFLSWDIFSRFQGHLEYGREHLRHLKLRCVEHGESLDHHTQYENTVVEGIKLIQKLPCVQVVHFVIEYYLPKEQRPMNLVFRFVRDGSRFAMLFGFTNTGFYLGVDYAVVRPQPTGWSLRCRFEDFANHRAHHRWLKFVDRALTVLGTQQHAFKQLSDQHDRWIWNVES